MKKEKHTIDYLFIGLGASNCLLILELEKKGLLDEKKIIILEPKQKNKKDKTYCFWATSDEVKNIIPKDFIDKEWESVILNGKKQDLHPLKYYHVSSLTLYEKALKVVNIHGAQIFSEKLELRESAHEIKIDGKICKPKYAFDSRPPLIENQSQQHFYVNQSFVGWQIQTKEDTFNPNSFTMMDFEIPQDNATQFVYVLPFDTKNALVEVTRFGKEVMSFDHGKKLLNNYLKNYSDFQVLDVETGCIPMTDAVIPSEKHTNVRNMGARAGHVKPSTGYAFKSMSLDATNIANQIASENKIIKSSDVQLRDNRFAFYDSLLLRILTDEPNLGKPIFKRLFNKIKATNILYFLDEESKFKEELKIFYSLQWLPFIRAAIKQLWTQNSPFKKTLVPLILTLVFLIFSSFNVSYLIDGSLLIGLVFFGIPHGAIDHLLETNQFNQPITLKFIGLYLAQGASILLLWYLSPIVALFIFLAYSIYHFAQADYKEWKLNSAFSWIWGLLFFIGILLSHPNELNEILNQLTVPELPNLSGIVFSSLWNDIAVACLAIGVFMGFRLKSKAMISISLTLLLSIQLSLIQAFGIYFIFNHSLLGWSHLKNHFKVNSIQLWKKAALFSFGAYALFFLLYWILNEDFVNYVGTFFIFLSAISFPHVIRMNKFYDYFKN